MELNDRLEKIAGRFDISLEVDSIIPIKGGHINSTFRIINSKPNKPDVILQKINQHVFNNVEDLMNNLVLVTHFIQRQDTYQDLVASIIPTKKGNYWLESEGEVWRMHEFIPTKKTFETAESPEMCHKAGFTYGSFLKAVDTISHSEIKSHIPDFHNIQFRLRQLDEASMNPIHYRYKIAKPTLKEMDQYRGEMCALLESAETGNLPVRVLHNDTKLSNVLIGEGNVGTVIDLDTIMPGYVFFDTGDALRSIAVNAKEDDDDLGSIELNDEFKNAFIEGCLKAAGDILNTNEIKSIDHSGAYMAYIMAVRFMADYLKGDKYYATNYPEQNLTRAKNQLKVCALFSSG